ncbi:Tyrosyl-tRNA synthetase [Caldithrix abyssi DSM 13497]|uniref:Tyrosine--tRNA ligase n=1 Tax=Caldithrix abyssi DSM 13497 TaxID=880073 RepID=H1XRM9_CALAY|nr:tyrosine--tRNA ligase [Caldithrix abyssi]APF20113.1 tyrS tyrosyl-tRNA synthetase [Caldithrix abyssi DSM 13497]EHO40182.1 Tyrosyl-tRNA synthetase [Caldithrix abyssi DSM 13497]
MTLLEELKQRGLIYQTTHEEELAARLRSPLTVYAGFDPTADSLHVGHLLPIITLRRFYEAGHRIIALIGGGTALIGDPSGKNEERQLLTQEVILNNAQKIKAQLSRLLGAEKDPQRILILNNYDWLSKQSLIDFLRQVGKYFKVNEMIKKDSVKQRLESEQGISFLEFSYQLFQAYDFYYLKKEYDCVLQIGGSDQWGNITGGMDLIAKKSLEADSGLKDDQAFGLTMPLILDSEGKKIGKTSEGEVVWLEADKMLPYDFYQYWIRVNDDDVLRFLKYFTFKPLQEIEALEKEVAERPEKRAAQQALAGEVTEFVHGQAALQRIQRISRALFYGDVSELDEGDFQELARHIPSAEVQLGEGMRILDFLKECGFIPSKQMARNLIKSRAIRLNGRVVDDIDYQVTENDLLFGRFIMVRKGKKDHFLVLAPR